jgi:hypothetical protein
MLFISDIRLGEGDKIKFEQQVTRDNALQLGWIKILKPKYSLLKFRLPYLDKSINYVKGRIMYQTWPKETSGETRLLVSKAAISSPLVSYDFKTYEESMFFHNKWTRRYCFPVAKGKSLGNSSSPSHPSDPPSIVYKKGNQYCTCYDCMSELYILEAYSKLPGSKSLKTVLTEINNPRYDLKRPIFDQKKPLEIIDDELIKRRDK